MFKYTFLAAFFFAVPRRFRKRRAYATHTYRFAFPVQM